MTALGSHVPDMNPIWEALSRVLVTVMAAGIVALVALQWSTQREIATIRGDIGIIRSENAGSNELMKYQITATGSGIAELRARVSQLESQLAGTRRPAQGE